MPRCGETTHVEPDFGDDDLRRQRADTGDLVEALCGGQPVAATMGRGAVGPDRRLGGGLDGDLGGPGGGRARVARTLCVDCTAGTASPRVAGPGGEQGL